MQVSAVSGNPGRLRPHAQREVGSCRLCPVLGVTCVSRPTLLAGQFSAAVVACAAVVFRLWDPALWMLLSAAPAWQSVSSAATAPVRLGRGLSC